VEDIPTGYSKIRYHMPFDIKYGLRNKVRLVAGDIWTLNDKEDIYSGVLCMYNVRIGYFLGELHGISFCARGDINVWLKIGSIKNFYGTHY
jgi:hypothetical protein